MRHTELVSLCGVVLVAAVCGGFGIYSLIISIQGGNALLLVPPVGVLFFCGISIAAILIAWSGWKRPS